MKRKYIYVRHWKYTSDHHWPHGTHTHTHTHTALKASAVVRLVGGSRRDKEPNRSKSLLKRS